MTTISHTAGGEAGTLVFIDSRVPDWQALAAALPAGSEWQLIDGGSDGLAQIAAALAGRSGLQALHILSHGAQGSVQLGASTLDAAALAAHAGELAAIGAAMAQDGDILLYGCEAGAGSAGAALVETLAALTGADVAASVDTTGAAALGGNWLLERHSGIVQAAVLESAHVLDATLATTTTFDFSTGVVDALSEYAFEHNDNTVRSDVRQQVGGNVLKVTADRGRVVVVNESDALGADDPFFSGKLFSTDESSGLPAPTKLSLTVEGGKSFDLLAISLLEVYGNLAKLTLTTNKGAIVPIDVAADGMGKRLSLQDYPELIGVTRVDLTDQDGDPLTIMIDDVVLSNIAAPSTPPAFVTSTDTITVSQNSAAFDLTNWLKVSDPDAGETLAWSASTEASKGSVDFGGATAAAGGANIVPAGMPTYTPAAGFTGSHTISVQVSDGTASATKTITVNVTPQQPGMPDLHADTDTGASFTDNVTNAASLDFSGTSADGDNSSTIRVFIDKNGNGVYDAGDASRTEKVRADGTWSVGGISTAGLEGDYHVYAVVTSFTDGLTSTPSAPLPVKIDHIAPAISFSNIFLSNDTGTSSIDRNTNVALQTISATLSQALATGETVQGSLDKGASWTDITSMVSGTTLAWTGAMLVAGGGIQLRVLDKAGNASTVVPQAYTLDQTAPTTTVASALFSADSGEDFILGAVNQALSGTLSANLAAGEVVEVSLDNGASWTQASALAGSAAWSLSGITLAASNTLQVRVKDAAGNAGTAFTKAYLLDTAAPTAALPASTQLLAPSGASFTVTVTYSDTGGAGIDTSTFSTGNIGVTGPLGNNVNVTGFSASGNTVTYTVAAPGGSWDAADAGRYTVAIKANSVRDSAGNAVAANAAAAAVDVVFSTAPAVSALSLFADSGSSVTDFITNTAAQTIGATLSRTLLAGETVQGSLDNGATWTDITAKVSGTAIAWNGVTLAAGGTIVVRVVDGNGLSGAAASHTYSVDTAAPTQSVSLAALAVDSGAAGDFITNTAAQTLSGALSAPLGAGEFVEVSLDNGSSWTTAAASGNAWNLAGITLPASGTLQVRVSDIAGNHGTAWSHSYLLDTSAPTAGTPVRPNLVDPSGASFTFTVTYADSGAGIDLATIGTGNVSVSGPGGFLSVIGASPSGNTVTYTAAAPGGSWDPADSGSYTIGINAGVKDLAGNTVAANASAGSFGVSFAAPAVSALSLSADSGSSATDFITNTAAQTVGATLSRALFAGETVQGSLDNGATWIDITAKTSGTTLAWDGVTLPTSGTLVVRVLGTDGSAGTAASQAYVLDTQAPVQTVASAALSADSSVNGDFITNIAAQTLSGALSAPLGAGEFVEVSLDDGSSWTTAAASGSTWSLGGMTLAGAGTLQVRVSDVAGNHGTAWTQAYQVDTTAPTAGTPVRPNLVDPSGSSFTFTVTYADSGAGIDLATIGTGNVSVSGPGGTLAVLAASASGNTVTYTVAPPGGRWEPFHAGSYTIGINAGVKDLAGNTVAAKASAGSFGVSFAAPAVSALSLSADSGSSATDFITNTAAQTIGATLSRALVAGETVQGSLDNGATWTDITAKTSGTAIAWNGVTLPTSGTLVVRVLGTDGSAGTAASQAYVLDTQAPVQTVVSAALSADSSVNGDFITNIAAQTLSGALSAPLGAGDFVEVSLDNGASWTTATGSGSTWSLAGVTLAGAGTLQVRVSDVAGNHGTAWTQAYQLDTTAPTASTPARADLVDPSGASFTFTVTYADSGAGIDPATIGTGNVSVSGPGGVLSVVGASASGNTVTYTVAAPGGSWDPADSGSYTIGINAGVRDLAGNTMGANASAGSFTVSFAAPMVSALSLSADNGSSATDFITNTAAQTIGATLSRALVAGETVQGSLDNGATWTDITAKTSGTAIAWNGVTLPAGGTLVVRVLGTDGSAGTPASQAYTLDTAAPLQSVTSPVLSADTGAAGDFITNIAAQTLSGALSTPLGAGEFVEVSLDDGSSWTTAAASGSTWSLGGMTLAGAGTLHVRVSDVAGNHGTSWTQAYQLDTTAPTAGTPVRPNLMDPSGASFTFTVTYADGGASIDPATIGTGNVSVSGPGGPLSILHAAASGNTVTYTAAAPGGSWDPADSGSYTIGINAGVRDLAGNTVAANAAAGSFGVRFAAPAVSALSLSADSGSSATDFITNTAAQTIGATLSRALVAGETVQGSLDNGATWTDITDKTSGTTLAWNGVTLPAGGTLVVRVLGTDGSAGTAASQAYTLDTAAPLQSVTSPVLSADTGAAGDFITNTAAQTLSGALSAPLGAGEIVEVSLDNGSSWTTAAASGNAWNLGGMTLPASGTLQVRVSDVAGNHGTSWTQAYQVDTTAPTAGTPVRPNLVDPSGASFSFTLTYADSGAGIDPATIGTGNVSVSGPRGPLSILHAAASGNTVTYTAAAPGGSWDPADSGSYTIGINAGVRDLAGNTVAANAAAGSFGVRFAAPAVSALSLSADSGSSATDFITNTAAQTIGATLSRALVAGETVQGSLDNGATWTDITAKTSGTTLAWNGVTLPAGGTLVVRVLGTDGSAGTAASQAYTLDTAAPLQSITSAALSADTGAAGDFITNTAAQTLSGALSAPLGAGEIVEVSLDNGSSWTTAAASGNAWNLGGMTLPASGTLHVRVSDVAGNHGTSWTQAYQVDTTAPTAGTPVRPNLVDPSGASFSFTVTYADGGAGIDPATIGTGNVSVSGPGGTLAVLAASASGNTVTYTVAPPGGRWEPFHAGSYTIGINAGVRDLAGNTVAANASAHSFTVSMNSAPVLGGLSATPEIRDDATTSPFAGVSVADLDGDALTLTIAYTAANGTLSGTGLGGSAGNYMLSGGAAEIQAALRGLVFTPTANQSAGAPVVTTFTLSASDGKADTSNSAAVVSAAPVAPTATVGLSDADLRAGESAILTLNFSEAVTGLGADDLTLTGLSLGTLESSNGGRTWTAAVTPAAGIAAASHQVQLDLAGVLDAGGLAGSGVVTGPSYTIRTSRPTATLSVDDTVLSAGESATLTIVFSEAVSGFSTADLTVGHGTLDKLASSDGITWTATLTPAPGVAAATNTVRLDLAGVQNTAGNAGSGIATSNTYAVATVPDEIPAPLGGTIDGVPVETGTYTDPATGLVNQTIGVPVVGAGRADDPNSPNAPLADIPLTAVGGGASSTLTLSLPVGAGMQANGPANLLGRNDALLDLIRRIEQKTAAGSDTREQMTGEGSGFLDTLAGGALLQTATVAPVSGAATDSVLITGGAAGGVALGIVIDAGGLHAGTTLRLDHVDFAAVVGSATLRGGLGNNIVVGDSASQNIFLGEGDDQLYGGGGDDVIGSAGGDDLLDGGSGKDFLAGGIGNDRLAGGSGDDVLQGGRSSSGAWQFTLDAGGTLGAVHQTAMFAPGAQETVALAELDRGSAELAFLSASRATLTDMALLYQAAFGRAPDVAGLNFYLAGGVDAAAVARSIVASAEWSGGGMATLSDNVWVQGLYRQAFEREGDSGGVAFWTRALASGALSRADVLLEFARAGEHRALHADHLVVAAAQVGIENGWILGSGDDRLEGGAGSDLLVGGDGTDTVVYAGTLADYRFLLGADGRVKVADKANADVDTLSGIELGEFSDGTVDLGFTQAGAATLEAVGLLYQTLLDRAGDLGGLSWWVGSGLEGAGLVRGFTASAEFTARYGAMSDAAFVAALYANSGLDANAAGGSAAWVDMLQQHSRAELVGSWIVQQDVLAAHLGSQGLWLV